MKHTPGEWTYTVGCPFYTIEGDERRVGTVAWHDLHPKEQLANARLIKAAPKLLEAAVDALKTLQSIRHFLHDHELDSIEYLTLAIAEATGE